MATLFTKVPDMALASLARAYEKAKRRLNDGIDVSLENGEKPPSPRRTAQGCCDGTAWPDGDGPDVFGHGSNVMRDS